MIAASLFAEADVWLHSRVQRAPGDFVVVSERLVSVGLPCLNDQPAAGHHDGKFGPEADQFNHGSPSK